jgi:hypothetical protein
MTFAAFATALMLTTHQAPALPDELVISAVVLDKKGHAVLDLKPEEFVVTESGSERPIARAELDSRPLNVALLLDTSTLMGDTYNADVIPAAVSFLKRLPQGATFSIWSTSDRPKVIVEQGTDVSAVETKLRNVAPFGHNAALDTLVAASQELAKDETRPVHPGATPEGAGSHLVVVPDRVEAGNRSQAGQNRSESKTTEHETDPGATDFDGLVAWTKLEF